MQIVPNIYYLPQLHSFSPTAFKIEPTTPKSLVHFAQHLAHFCQNFVQIIEVCI